jgi:glycosyltransferase involved in cell wall biosynthesis
VDHRIKLLQKRNGGLASARNHGIAHAGGEFIAPIDADDLWHPEKIRKQMAVMRDRGIGLSWSIAGRGLATRRTACSGMLRSAIFGVASTPL